MLFCDTEAVEQAADLPGHPYFGPHRTDPSGGPTWQNSSNGGRWKLPYQHPDWCYWMDEAQAHAQAGYCYLKLGDHTRARGHLRHGLTLQDSSYSREGTLRQVLLATTYLHQDKPELDQALAHGGRALDALAGDVDSTRCIGHLARLIDSLGPFRRSAHVSEFLDQAKPVLARTRAT